MAENHRSYQRDYVDQELRERLKEEIKNSGRGGAPGQWSARKSQLLTREYEGHGGRYRHPDQPTAAQRSLKEWGEQRWQTESGSTYARHDGETERYLPQKAWEELAPQERRETQRAKRSQSRRGRQHVPNPPAAKHARVLAELDELPAHEAVKRVRRLTREEAESALRHEEAHKARKTVLRQLDKAVHHS